LRSLSSQKAKDAIPIECGSDNAGILIQAAGSTHCRPHVSKPSTGDISARKDEEEMICQVYVSGELLKQFRELERKACGAKIIIIAKD